MCATTNTPVARQALQCKGGLAVVKGQGSVSLDGWHHQVRGLSQTAKSYEASACSQVYCLNKYLGHGIRCR